MNTFDISPRFRSTVGFDRLFEPLDRVWDRTATNDVTGPQYDVLKTGENSWRIALAVPGYQLDGIDIELHDRLLTVKGERADAKEGAEEGEYLYRSISGRTFTRSFELGEHVQVEGARLRDGLLHIELKREVPEALRPRKIEVTADEKNASVKQINTQAA